MLYRCVPVPDPDPVDGLWVILHAVGGGDDVVLGEDRGPAPVVRKVRRVGLQTDLVKIKKTKQVSSYTFSLESL